MRISAIEPESLSRRQATRLLFGDGPPDDGQGNCILVLGGPNPERVTTAVSLYRSGKAPHILFSGGTKWGQRPEAEAITMRRQALELGVPDADISVEAESNHTKENVLASLLVLDRAVGLHHLHRLLVVSAPWHMRRCLLTLQTYMPHWIEYGWHPDDRPFGQAHNWWERPENEARVMQEARSLVAYVREGQLLDIEVNLEG